MGLVRGNISLQEEQDLRRWCEIPEEPVVRVCSLSSSITSLATHQLGAVSLRHCLSVPRVGTWFSTPSKVAWTMTTSQFERLLSSLWRTWWRLKGQCGTWSLWRPNKAIRPTGFACAFFEKWAELWREAMRTPSRRLRTRSNTMQLRSERRRPFAWTHYLIVDARWPLLQWNNVWSITKLVFVSRQHLRWDALLVQTTSVL